MTTPLGRAALSLYLLVVAANADAALHDNFEIRTTAGVASADYDAPLAYAAGQLTELLQIDGKDLPFLTVVISQTSAEREAYVAADLAQPYLLLSEDLLQKKQGQHATLADVVAHEACHLWLIELAEQHGIAQRKQMIPQYGHSEFNDWFDEMVAVSCEGSKLQQQRTTTAFTPIPMAQFLTQVHPVYAQLQARIAAAVAARKQDGEQGQSVIKLTVDNSDFARYYKQSAHFYQFLRAQQPDLSAVEWFNLATLDDAEHIAQQLGFKSLAALERSFIEFVQSSAL